MFDLLHPGNKFASISTIRPDQTVPRKTVFDSSQDLLGSITILLVVGVHDKPDDQPIVSTMMFRLRPRIYLARIVSPQLPFSVVFTL